MEKEIEIGKLNEIYEKYGDLGFQVDTPYGYHDITWCGITEQNADVYRCELEDGKYVEGADYHRLKNEDGDFVVLKDVEIGEPIQTVDGVSKIKSIELLDEKDTLYDIQVDEVHQYYSNGIVSHNTTLTVDAIKYLFFGTTTKTNKNEEVFNQYSDNNELIIRGMIDVEGDDEFIIERRLKRKPKRKGGWTIENKVNYYRVLPDGEEILMNDADAIKTTKAIKETFGNEKDFDLVALVTSRNLDNLVDATSTESGKLLTKFIGLEVIAKKEAIVRKMYSTFNKTMKSNIYSSSELKSEVEEHENNLEWLKHDKIKLESNILKEKNLKNTLNDSKIKLIESKDKVDSNILSLNPSRIESDIESITKTGIKYKEEKKKIKNEIDGLGDISFDEELHFDLTNKYNTTLSQLAINKGEIDNINNNIKNLIKGGICQSCNRPLEDVDNTDQISKLENNIKTLLNTTETLKLNNDECKSKLSEMFENKNKIDVKNKLELRFDRLDVELHELRVKLKSKKLDYDNYLANISSIDKNKNIDSEISIIDTEIIVKENEIDSLNKKLQNNIIDSGSNEKDIKRKKLIIESISKEIEVDRLFKIYIEMIGKKGISKLVLRSVLPIINSELQRLLDEITDFDVEVYVDEKNEVRYLLVKDGVEKPLKSGSGFELTAASIALRCVLGKMSSLPTPNFIAFDEVLGRVAPVNITAMKPLFERISDMFELVFFITQNDLVKDWANGIITVVKDKNISKIKN